jgi:L-amino acid N-acyltransferase YncA
VRIRPAKAADAHAVTAIYNEGIAGREVGVERRHGRLEGEWRDCVPVERLLGEAAG